MRSQLIDGRTLLRRMIASSQLNLDRSVILWRYVRTMEVLESGM